MSLDTAPLNEPAPECAAMPPASLSLPRADTSTVRSALFSAQAQRAWLLAFVVLVVLMSYLAFRPADAFHPTLGWDKLNHAAAFLTMAFSGHFAFRERPRATFWVVFSLLALGIAIELLQTYIPGRQGEVEDLLADAVGLFMGLLLALGLARRLERRKQPRRKHPRRDLPPKHLSTSARQPPV